MKFMYMVSFITEDDVYSSLFKSKDSAVSHIQQAHSDYKRVAENREEDIEYWRKLTGEGIVLEKLRVED